MILQLLQRDCLTAGTRTTGRSGSRTFQTVMKPRIAIAAPMIGAQMRPPAIRLPPPASRTHLSNHWFTTPDALCRMDFVPISFVRS